MDYHLVKPHVYIPSAIGGVIVYAATGDALLAIVIFFAVLIGNLVGYYTLNHRIKVKRK